MSDLFDNKYRVKTARHPAWNYGWQGSYFITICTKDQECYFGSVKALEMHLSDVGKIVQQEWTRTADLRVDMNLDVSCYTIMPNHFHAIVTIGENRYNSTRRDAMHRVSTPTADVLFASANRYGSQRKNLASIVRGFKSAVTNRARRINSDFSWQPQYHEHIIKSEEAYFRIKQYIADNPLLWKQDKFYIPYV
jgi:REP element-mobilizing transposase RayT